MSKALDLKGRRFGRLTVLERAENDKYKNSRWVCECDCGAVKTLYGKDLKNGSARSCGCYRKEVLLEGRTHAHTYTHNMSNSRLYNVYRTMRQRCFNTNNPSYKNYGGRGVTVCGEWSRFEVFRDWALSNGYKEDLTIERINVNGNYCPENCTWISIEDQQRNRRNNVKFRGKTQSTWAYVLDLSQSSLVQYKKRHNCSLEKAVRYHLLQKFI